MPGIIAVAPLGVKGGMGGSIKRRFSVDDAARFTSPTALADRFVDNQSRVYRLIDASACRSLIRVSPSTWKRLVARGLMPRPIKIGACNRWDEDEVLAAVRQLADLRK